MNQFSILCHTDTWYVVCDMWDVVAKWLGFESVVLLWIRAYFYYTIVTNNNNSTQFNTCPSIRTWINPSLKCSSQ